MLFLGGLFFALLCVFGSFVASGGALAPLAKSMPFELLTIVGAALGIFVMGNSKEALKQAPGYLKLTLHGARYDKAAYLELLVTLFRFTRLAQAKGNMALEEHIENPAESSIFAMSPGVRDDIEVRNMICDYLRLVSLNMGDAYQLDEVMARELKKNITEKLHMSECLQSIADAAGAGYRGRRAGRDQDDGVNQQAPRHSGRHDRWRAGGHLPWRASVLWCRGPTGGKDARCDTAGWSLP